MKVICKKIIPNVPPLSYATQGSAGVDLRAMRVMALYKGTLKVDLAEKMNNSLSQGKLTLRPNERVLLGTGWSIIPPPGYLIDIRDKSGICLKRGLKVLNAPGTIDEDYTGEIGVIILNTTDFLAEIQLEEFIAQAVLIKYEKMEFIEEAEVSSTERGAEGFGSTGNGL